MKFGMALSSLGHGELAPLADQVLELKERHGLNHIEISMSNLDGNPWILWPWEYTDTAISRMRDLVMQFESRGVHLPMGRGNIDFEAIVSALAETGHQGAFTLKYNPDHADQIDRHIEDAQRRFDGIEGNLPHAPGKP